jgi:hypothetical protein
MTTLCLIISFNIFKAKTNCHSTMDFIGIRVPTRQIKECSTFIVSYTI